MGHPLTDLEEEDEDLENSYQLSIGNEPPPVTSPPLPTPFMLSEVVGVQRLSAALDSRIRRRYPQRQNYTCNRFECCGGLSCSVPYPPRSLLYHCTSFPFLGSPPFTNLGRTANEDGKSPAHYGRRASTPGTELGDTAINHVVQLHKGNTTAARASDCKVSTMRFRFISGRRS